MRLVHKNEHFTGLGNISHQNEISQVWTGQLGTLERASNSLDSDLQVWAKFDDLGE